MKKVFSETFRILPDDCLRPLPLERWFPAGAAQPRPLEVDVGCGKGRFLLARAASHADVDFLGIDRMIGRLHKIDRKAVRRELKNIRWLRLDAYYAVAYMVPANSVTTYYIFFPDPWPKKRHREHRLFNAAFLDALFRTLKAGGKVHFATDHLPYFDDVVAVIKADRRFAEIPPFEPAEEERTDFELIYLGQVPIGRYSFEKDIR
jgi:tRNA (guanine-N7-)-methyltransferase